MEKSIDDHDSDGYSACSMGRPRTPPASLGPRAANAWLAGWDACDRTPRLQEDIDTLEWRREEHARRA